MPDPGRFATPRNLKVEDLIQRYDKIIPQVDEDLKQSGIADEVPIPVMPDGLDSYVVFGKNDDPEPPKDLTVVGLEVIGKLFSFFSQWTNYVQAELTRAQCEAHVLKRHQKVIGSALSIWYREEEQKPATSVDDYVTTDARFVEIDASLMRAEVFVKKAESRYEQLKRYINVISREQTRRTDEFGRENHGDRTVQRPTGRRWRPKG